MEPTSIEGVIETRSTALVPKADSLLACFSAMRRSLAKNLVDHHLQAQFRLPNAGPAVLRRSLHRAATPASAWLGARCDVSGKRRRSRAQKKLDPEKEEPSGGKCVHCWLWPWGNKRREPWITMDEAKKGDEQTDRGGLSGSIIPIHLNGFSAE